MSPRGTVVTLAYRTQLVLKGKFERCANVAMSSHGGSRLTDLLDCCHAEISNRCHPSGQLAPWGCVRPSISISPQRKSRGSMPQIQEQSVDYGKWLTTE